MVRQQEGRLLYCVDLFMQANNTCIVLNLHVRTIHKQGGWSDGRMVDCNVWMHSHMKSYCRLAQFYLSYMSYKPSVDDFEQSDNRTVDCTIQMRSVHNIVVQAGAVHISIKTTVA